MKNKATKPAGERFLKPREFLLDDVRRARWAKVGFIYTLLLLISIIFMGPLLFGALSSLKDQPLEWPPRIETNQLKFHNWMGVYRSAKKGGGHGFFGEFTPGTEVPFEVTYRVQSGMEPVPPTVQVPRRVAGTTVLVNRSEHYAADYTEIGPVQEITRKKLADGSLLVRYRFMIKHTGNMVLQQLPLDLTVPFGEVYAAATFDPNRIERQGRVQSWNNLTSGLIPYVFHNYHRIFNENYSRSSGKSMFVSWFLNSFNYSIIRVLTTILFASMAGYALARLRFKGKNFIFVTMLFSMMVPSQVTFISNYLVLRDGIFGLTRLFGMQTLLNSYAGLIISGVVGASSVFIMKQFFQGMPGDMEESAKLDGASTYQAFFRIYLPLAKPAMSALTILTFQGVWNEFFWPLVVINAPQERFPLTVGMLSLRRTYGVYYDWGPILAASIVAILPIIVVFIVFQRYFIEGINFSGSKG